MILFGLVKVTWLGTPAQQHEREVKDAIAHDGLVQAIKIRRQKTGEGLKEAYDYVKKVRAKYDLPFDYTR
jgi:ribosomal protein L7/L12